MNQSESNNQPDSKISAINCPTCGRPIQWTVQFPFRPFCSEQCKLIDLGEWASENYRIKSEEPAEHALEDQPMGPEHL